MRSPGVWGFVRLSSRAHAQSRRSDANLHDSVEKPGMLHLLLESVLRSSRCELELPRTQDTASPRSGAGAAAAREKEEQQIATAEVGPKWAGVGRSGSEWVPGGNVNYVFGCNVHGRREVESELCVSPDRLTF